MLGSGLRLKIDEEKAHLPCCCVDVYSLCEVCVGSVLGGCSLPARYPQACREDSCQARIWFLSSLFNADEVVCGAVMAGVVSAVFHLTHLVQWNK